MLNFKNVLVSRFNNFKSTQSQTMSLYDWLNDTSNVKLVDYIRSQESKEERSIMKAKLPATTPSGVFTVRKASGLVAHSGLICIDIDSGDNPDIADFEELRSDLGKIVNIAYSALSVSGKGVYCLIPIKYPEKHKEHFQALKIIFEQLGIVLDKACGDVCRLRIYSYDSNAYINEGAIPFELTFDRNNKREKALVKTNYDSEPRNTVFPNSTRTRVIKVITQINLNHVDITESYEQWFQIGCALAHEFGEEGREFFHLVSENHPKYHTDVTDRKFSECLQNPYSYTIGTFFYWAEQYGLK